MFSRGKKETSFAAQVATVGYIVDGTSYVKFGYSSISRIPLLIQK
jgi:hypothetical protein